MTQHKFDTANVNYLDIKKLLHRKARSSGKKLTFRDVANFTFQGEKIEPVTAASYISAWNNGRLLHKIRPRHIVRLCDYLEATTVDLIIYK